MPAWVWGFILLAGGLFVLKLTYLMGIALAVRTTGGALFTSTASIRVRAFLDAVPMGPNDLLVDLGCGDGRVLREARGRYGVRALGYEINPSAYLLAKIRCGRIHGIEVRREDFWNADLSEASVVFCYLFPDLMASLARKLERELRQETVVISANFPIPEWTACVVLHPDSSRHGDPIYIYHLRAACDSPTMGSQRDPSECPSRTLVEGQGENDEEDTAHGSDGRVHLSRASPLPGADSGG